MLFRSERKFQVSTSYFTYQASEKQSKNFRVIFTLRMKKKNKNIELNPSSEIEHYFARVYLHPTVRETLALACPSSLKRVHSYRPASAKLTFNIVIVDTLSKNKYFAEGGCNFLPLNIQVTLEGGKLDTTQLKFTASFRLASAEETPTIRGASEKTNVNAK